MTSSPAPGGPTGAPRNSRVLDASCRTRDDGRRIAAALVAVLVAGAVLVNFLVLVGGAEPRELHRKVRHAAILLPR